MPKIPEDLASSLLPGRGEAIDPVEMARRDQKKSLPKRFYTSAAVDPCERDGAPAFAITLDGKRVRTPGQKLLAVSRESLAEAMVAEWSAQGEFIDPAAMPLTRLINSAIDAVAREMDAVAAEIVKYGGSDLLCYRAGEPESLVAAQRQHWDPLTGWIHEQTGVRPVLAEGVVYCAQEAALAPAMTKLVAAAVAEGPDAPLRLAALNVMTTLTGSAFLALAVASGRLTLAQAWAAANVDEDHQMQVWGEDAQALARRAARWREMAAAGRVFDAV